MVKLDATGSLLRSFITSTPALSTSNALYHGSKGGVAVDAAGNVYVADYSNHRVVKLHATGSLLRTFTASSSGLSSVAVDEIGNMFLSAVASVFLVLCGVIRRPTTFLVIQPTVSPKSVMCVPV